MATERIETLISKEALGQFDELNAKLALSVTGFEKLISKGVEINKALGGSKTFKEINRETQALTANEKALTDQIKQLEAATAKLNSLNATQAKELAAVKLQQQQRNQAIKEEIQLNQAAEGSIYKKQVQIKQLQREYDRLSATERNAARGQQLLKSIQLLDKELKDLEASTGRFQRNVGNYSGAVKILEKSLNDVRKRLDDMNQSGNKNTDVIRQLRKEEELLNQLLGTQVNGFITSTAEIRENTKALQALAAQGLQGTEAYRELFKATADLKDETSDLKKAITNAAPDDVAFNAAADAARGLIGIYGLAKSASAAFGIENEALQETMVKLQAAETALQSIEAIRAVFKKENAVRQAINIGLQKVEILQTNLQTASESRNIIVKYGAIAAQKALNAVMALGSGPLLALIGGLSLLVLTLSSFSSASQKAALDFDKLNAEFDRDKNNLDDYTESVKRNGDEIVASLEAQFATEDSIRKQRVQNLRDQLKATIEVERERRAEAAETEKFLRDIAKRSQTEDLSEKELEQVEKAEQFLNNFKALAKQRADLASEIRVQITNNEKATTEESIKARQENIDILKSQLQTQAAAQQAIASNEERTFDERIAALRKFGSLQERIINNDSRKQLLTPGLSPSEIKLIEANRTAAIIQSRRDSNKAVEDLQKTFNQRERAAQYEIARGIIEVSAEKNLRIADDDKKNFEARLDANQKYFESQRALIIAQRDFELQNKTLTDSERLAIQKKTDNQLLFLQIDFLKKSNEISNQGLDQGSANSVNRNSARRDKLLADLAREREDGLVNEEDYQKRRLDIEFRYAKSEVQILINTTREKLDIRKAAGEDVTDLLAQLAAYERKLNEDSLAHTKETEEKKFQVRMERIQKIGEISSNIFGVVNELQQIQFDTEKARIEEEIANIEKRRDAELAAINASAISEQEKADKIQLLEAKTQAQKEQQERRLRQLEADRARFERATTVQRIIADTAAAVVAALGAKPYSPLNIALAATVGALGAAQLARVIATPLPRFAHGTDDAPGGLSIVGDGGRSELVKEPTGKMWVTPKVPTVMNVPKHSIVYPDARLMLESGLVVNRFGRLVETGQGTDTRKIEQKLDKLTSVVKNKPVLNMRAGQDGLVAMWEFGANRVEYVEDQVRF